MKEREMSKKAIAIFVCSFVAGAVLASCVGIPANHDGSPIAKPTLLPSSTAATNPLAGTRWQLTLLDGQKLVAGTSITMVFGETTMQGSAGCNTYGGGPDSGPYMATLDGTLAITQTAITVKECLEPEGILEQETEYMQVLHQAATYQLIDDRLLIFDKTDAARLEYERMP